MKGIIQQIEDKEVVYYDGKFTQEDLDNITRHLKIAIKKYSEYRKKRLKELENNRKALVKKSKKLKKEIPFELAFHCYLNFNRTYVTTDFLKKYKEWLD